MRAMTWAVMLAFAASAFGGDGAGQGVVLLGKDWGDVARSLARGVEVMAVDAEATIERGAVIVARSEHHAAALARRSESSAIFLVDTAESAPAGDIPVVTLTDDSASAIIAALRKHGLDVVTLGDDLDVRPLWRESETALWLHRSSQPVGGTSVWGNGLLALGPSGAVMLDTPWTNDQTERLLAWTSETLHANVTAAFVTHAHADAAGGTDALLARDIPVHGSVRTAEFAHEIDATPPSHTFEKHAVFEAAGLIVDMLAPGDGHAPGNAVASVRASDVIFGGCMVKSRRARGMGFVGDADLDTWPLALDAVGKRFATADLLIPGHGDPGPPAVLLGHTRKMVVAFRTRDDG